MQEDHIKQTIDKSFHTTLLLGYAIALLDEAAKHVPLSNDSFRTKLQWFNDAIENVIYLDCPPPKMP